MTGLQLFSNIQQAGLLEITLISVGVPKPGPNEVLVKMEAAPINPSDMWPMFGPADLSKATFRNEGKTLNAPVPKPFIGMMKSRWDQALPIGNEGAGTVIETGAGAEKLLGKTVSFSPVPLTHNFVVYQFKPVCHTMRVSQQRKLLRHL